MIEITIPKQTWTDSFVDLQEDVQRGLESLGRPLTAEEEIRNLPHTEATEQAAERANALQPSTLSPGLLAAELASVPPYPRVSLLRVLLTRLTVKQGVAFCEALVEEQETNVRVLAIAICFEWLAQQKTRAVLPLLVRWLRKGVAPRWTPAALAKNLDFPMVGDLDEATTAYRRAPSSKNAKILLRLLGVKGWGRGGKKSAQKRARALRSPTVTSLSALSDAPGTAVVVNLTGIKVRSFPDVLLRCTAMKHLKLNDDYFKTAQMRAIEKKLPGVAIKWGRGLHIDGKYGR